MPVITAGGGRVRSARGEGRYSGCYLDCCICLALFMDEVMCHLGYRGKFLLAERAGWVDTPH